MAHLGHVDVEDVLPQAARHALGEFHHRRHIDKAHFNVDLGEFRLTVGAQVFVAEAAGDLHVAVVTGHHQQLLKQLWRLRQGKELTRVNAGWHQVVAGAFGGGFTEDGGFHIQKALFVKIVADDFTDAVALDQRVLNRWSAQVEEAVTQADFFAHFAVLVHLEGGRLGFIQYVDGCWRRLRFRRWASSC